MPLSILPYPDSIIFEPKIGMLIVPRTDVKMNNNYSISGLSGSVLKIIELNTSKTAAKVIQIESLKRPDYVDHIFGERDLRYFKPLLVTTPKGNMLTEASL